MTRAEADRVNHQRRSRYTITEHMGEAARSGPDPVARSRARQGWLYAMRCLWTPSRGTRVRLVTNIAYTPSTIRVGNTWGRITPYQLLP